MIMLGQLFFICSKKYGPISAQNAADVYLRTQFSSAVQIAVQILALAFRISYK